MTQPLPPDLAEVEHANYREALRDYQPIVEPEPESAPAAETEPASASAEVSE
jgi:hypothetical protein